MIAEGKGVLLPPVGSGLLKSIEEEMGTNVDGLGVDFLMEALPGILRTLDLVDHAKFEKRGDVIDVSLEGARFSTVCKRFARGKSFICGVLGCPLCGSIALALAKATGRYVWLERHGYDERTRTTFLSLRLGDKAKAIPIPAELSKRVYGVRDRLGSVALYLTKRRVLPALALITLSAVATVTAFLTRSLLVELLVTSAFAVGFLLLHVALEVKVRSVLMGRAILSPLNALSHLLGKVGVVGRGTYLPSGEVQLPTKDGSFTMEPVGGELLRMMEREIGKGSMEEVLEKLPFVLTEKLGLAKMVDVRKKGSVIEVNVRGSKFSYLCDNLSKGPVPVCDTFGCPLCGSIGIVLAKATNRSVTMEKHSFDLLKDGVTLRFKVGKS